MELAQRSLYLTLERLKTFSSSVFTAHSGYLIPLVDYVRDLGVPLTAYLLSSTVQRYNQVIDYYGPLFGLKK